MSVPLPEDMLTHLLWALSSLMADRHGHVPTEVRYARQWLQIMSAVGHESDCNTEELTADDLIGTAQTAALLGYTERHVRRLQADLGAARLGRSLVFSRRQVIQYHQAREDHKRELAERGNPRN